MNPYARGQSKHTLHTANNNGKSEAVDIADYNASPPKPMTPKAKLKRAAKRKATKKARRTNR